MFSIDIPTKRGVVLNGVLFRPRQQRKTDTVMIAITGIHGNFYSNPFYYNIGHTLNTAHIDFIYAQTNNAFNQIQTINIRSQRKEIIGSWNERFFYTEEDIDAYLTFAQKAGYKHIILAGHSLGANKVIYYLSKNKDDRIEHFFLLSPANLDYMTSIVTEQEKTIIQSMIENKQGNQMLPFAYMGWLSCIANTAYDWQFSNILNNVHSSMDANFSQAQKIILSGALLVGTYDNFTESDPKQFLYNLNNHMPTAAQNDLIFIEKTGHTYQAKQQEVANKILDQLQKWR